MAIMRRHTRVVYADGTDSNVVSIGGGQAFGSLVRVDVKVTGDTTTAIDIVDAESVTLYTLASGDHTTIKRQYVEPVKANVVDTAGEAATADSTTGRGVVCNSPLTVTATGLDTGDYADVWMFFEV